MEKHPHPTRAPLRGASAAPLIALAALGWLAHAPAARAQAATPSAAPEWLACSAIADDAKALRCFRQWAQTQTPQAAPLSASANPSAVTPPPALSPAAAQANAAPAERECKNHASDQLAQYWDLDKLTDCETFVLRSYKPTTLMWAYSSSVNMQPSSPTAGHTAASAVAYRAAEMKLGLSVRTKIAKGILQPANESLQDSLWFGYTQASNWQLFNGAISRPFRTTDHEPELIYIFPHDHVLPFGHDWKWRYSGIAINHQSNGQTLPLSRSWNRIILMAGIEKHQKLSLQFKLWQRLPEKTDNDDNPEISERIGRAEASALWTLDNKRYQLGMTLRHPMSVGKGGSIKLDAFRTIGDLRTSALKLHVQLLSGYGESLVDYNRARTTLGVGLSLVDW